MATDGSEPSSVAASDEDGTITSAPTANATKMTTVESLRTNIGLVRRLDGKGLEPLLTSVHVIERLHCALCRREAVAM